MATTWVAIRDGMKTRLATISGLVAKDTVPKVGTADKNLAIVVYGEPFMEQAGHGDMVDIHLRVIVRVQRSKAEEMQDAIDAYIWPTGTNSIIAAVAADPTLGGIVDDTQWQGTGSIGPLVDDQATWQATIDFRIREFYI